MFLNIKNRFFKKKKQDVSVNTFDLNEFVETWTESVIGIKKTGEIVIWNPSAEKMFGWSTKEALGKTIESLIIPVDYRDLHKAGMARMLETGVSRILNKPMDLTALTKSGNTIPIEITIRSIPKNETISFVSVIRDNSEKLAEQKRKQITTVEARILHQIMDVFTKTSSIDGILKACSEIIGEACDWRVGHVLVNNKGRFQTTDIWYNGTNCPIDSFQEASQQIEGFQSPVFLGKSALSKEISWIYDVQDEEQFFRRDLCILYGLRGTVCIPIKLNNEVHYVLEFFSLQTVDLPPNELKFLTSVSEYIGKLIEEKEKIKILENH